MHSSEPRAQLRLIDEVLERLLAVDRDDRDPLQIGAQERVVAVDVALDRARRELRPARAPGSPARRRTGGSPGACRGPPRSCGRHGERALARGVGVEGEVVREGEAGTSRAALAIIAALSVHSSRGGTFSSAPRPSRRSRSGPIGRHAAADGQAPQAGLLQRALGALGERLDDRVLVGGGEVGAALVRGVLAEVAHAVEQRGLQPGEGEVQAREARGDREVERAGVAVARPGARAPGRPGSRARAGARPCRTPRRPRRRGSGPAA